MMYFSGGDGPFYFVEQLQHFSWLPTLWHPEQGFGVSSLVRLWYDYPVQVFIKFLFSLGFSWAVIDMLLWALPLGIGIISSWKLARYVLHSKIATIIASIMYCTNTYVLLLFGGGQLGVALGYALAPYVALLFVRMIDYEKIDIKQSILSGFWIGLLIAFDLRLAYLMIAAAILYFTMYTIWKSKSWKRVGQIVPIFIIPGIVAITLHLFWIVPLMLGGGSLSGVGGEYTGPGMLKFLSVADFSHTLSLLHPNWPENLFGKVYFLQPEFLVLPLIAFLFLLFIKPGKNKLSILYFAFLSLIGAFFAKGVNPPFGEIFNWCFIHVPGFVMFRDPTKFYLFIAMGYAVLIPYVLEHIGEKVKKMKWVIYVVFLIFWGYTIRPLFFGQLTGNFRPQSIPQEYIVLKDMLVADQVPSRTLWIPAAEKFSYASDVHPRLATTDVFKDTSMAEFMHIATSSAFLPALSDSGVRYVIVPSDVEGKMFMTEYKTDMRLRQNLISVLEQTPLVRLPHYRDVAVFENTQFDFRSEIPPLVEKQEYWSRIGLILDGVALGIIIVLLIRKKVVFRKKTD